MGITSEARRKVPPPRTRENDRLHAYAKCKTCNKTKPLTEFHKNGTGQKYRANDPRRYKKECGPCLKIRTAELNSPGYNPKRRGPRRMFKDRAHANRVRRRTTRIEVLQYLSKSGCLHCGTHDPRVLEFDHIDPAQKSETISRLVSGGYSWTSNILQREIRKCRILCANCHRIHTAEQQGNYAHEDVEDTLHKIFRDYGIEP